MILNVSYKLKNLKIEKHLSFGMMELPDRRMKGLQK